MLSTILLQVEAMTNHAFGTNADNVFGVLVGLLAVIAIALSGAVVVLYKDSKKSMKENNNIMLEQNDKFLSSLRDNTDKMEKTAVVLESVNKSVERHTELLDKQTENLHKFMTEMATKMAQI